MSLFRIAVKERPKKSCITPVELSNASKSVVSIEI